jgi:hypothetical protein
MRKKIMKMMSRFNLRFLLAGCALAMGIGISSSALAMPDRCLENCSDWFGWNPALAAGCAYGCNGF